MVGRNHDYKKVLNRRKPTLPLDQQAIIDTLLDDHRTELAKRVNERFSKGWSLDMITSEMRSSLAALERARGTKHEEG